MPVGFKFPELLNFHYNFKKGALVLIILKYYFFFKFEPSRVLQTNWKTLFLSIIFLDNGDKVNN